MTIKELISKLYDYPQDCEVLMIENIETCVPMTIESLRKITKDEIEDLEEDGKYRGIFIIIRENL